MPAGFAAAISSAVCFWSHQLPLGTDALTMATWLPQPAHVVLPQTLQVPADWRVKASRRPREPSRGQRLYTNV